MFQKGDGMAEFLVTEVCGRESMLKARIANTMEVGADSVTLRTVKVWLSDSTAQKSSLLERLALIKPKSRNMWQNHNCVVEPERKEGSGREGQREHK